MTKCAMKMQPTISQINHNNNSANLPNHPKDLGCFENKLIMCPLSVVRMKREKQAEMENKVTIEKP
jgi:hypothetical protein